MASKPIDPHPVALPNLSQLPDPTKDLFGGMTSPTALMSMNEKEVNDLFSVKPLTDMHIKPSAEAAKALQTAQQTQEAINRQAQQAQEALARQERELAEQRQRSIEEQIKLTRKDAEERAKALKEKADKQGGKLGAAPDGSFVLTADINKILGSQEWNSVVSDKQRGDRVEAYLSQYATQLKEMGATDKQIAAEIENGRGIFKAHTDAYTKSMRSDGQGLLDLTVAPAAKTGAFIFNTAGVLAKLVSADTVGDFLLERGKAATDAANDFESASIKLDRANSAYDEQKFNEANPNANWRDGGITGTAHGMGAAIKRAWDNDTLDNFVAEQIPQLIMTLGAGKVGATGVSAAGRAMGYTNLAANNVPTALRVLGGTYKTKSGITQLGVNALSGASLGVGAYGTAATVGDAGAGAWEQVKSTSFDDIKKTYGEKKWADAVALHGGEEQARDALAGEALERAAGKVAPVAAVTSFLGVESTFAALLTRQAVKEEAKKLTLKGFAKGTGSTALSATEEGVEEGYTQYASNVGATEFTGVDLMEGVSSAAGLGAFMGGATTAVTNIMSAAKKENDTLPNDFAKTFVEQGNFDDAAFRQNFERKMDWLSRGHKEGKVSTNDTQHFQQTYFNDYIDTAYTVTREDGATDTKSIWDLMTPEQAQSFKDYVQLNYGINTNNYSRHQDTVEYDAIKHNNMEVLSRPENADLLNVWRILNNTDTNQVPADKRDYYMALADTTIQLRPTETTHNTHEREQVFAQFRDTELKNRGFDETQLTGITEFARSILGANSRRFTDEEQQAWNELQQEQSNGTNEQNQTDNSQSVGQGPIDENAGPVATQSGGTGTSQATTLRQAAEELADAFSGRPASPDTQSVGNGNPRQGADTSSQTNTPTENGAGVVEPNAGAGQAQATGDTVNPTTPEIRSGTPTQPGNIGQTNQGGQSVGPTVARATQATTGGGSVGTPQAKRNSNGGGKQTPTQRANSLAETGADISIEFVQQFINNKKPKKLTLAKVKGYVADKLGVPVSKDTPTPAQVLQYLAKIPNTQFIADLSKVFTSNGGKIVKDSQNTINDLHATRHELYKAWVAAQPKTNTEQAPTDTNNINGSQDVDETNVADIADENPQAVVEQPVQTADDVETVEQAEELVEDVIDFLLDTYPDLDVNEVLSSIYEHYDVLNDYFINIPSANDQLADLFLQTSKIIEDKARYNRYTNALQNASVAAELVGDDFNMVFDNTIASADPAVTNNIEKRISRLEQYTELALEDAQNQQQENDRISAIREFNDEVERHNRELDEAIRNTGIEVPHFILQTSPVDISNAIAELVTPPSKRGKSKRAKLVSKKIKLPKSDKGNKQNLNQLVGDTRESVIITGAYDAPKTGHLVGTDTGVLFVPDDGMTAFELPTRPIQHDTINSWNKKNADTGISLDYTYHSFYDNEFYTRGDDFELNEVTAKQETANERATKKALYDRQKQSRVDETSTSEQVASDNRREKVISQDENGRWRMQVANNRLPALRADTTPAVVETPRASDRTIRLGTDVATDTGLGVIALDYKSDVQVSDAVQQLADETGLDFAQLTNLFVQELQNPVTFPYTQAQIDNLLARLDDEAENRAIPQTRVRRTPTVTETTNADEQNQTETEPRESSPTTDTTTTQDTAGASGLTGDTQTTASQAVKPKRGGRSKKKTTTQLDSFEQEQTNAKENDLGQSVQPTQDRTQDDNEVIRGRTDNEPTNDGQGEILGQSGQPVSEQSQESGTETTQDTNELGVETPTTNENRASRDDNAVAQQINEAVEKEHLQKEFDLINDYHNSLPLSKQEDTVEQFIEKIGYALALEQSTTWQQAEADAQAKLKAEREARWTKLREQEAQGIYEDDFDISENTSAIQSDIDAFTSERGIRMGSQTGAVELEFLLALPIAVYRAAKAIWNAIKKNVAAVSMALAITTGTTLAIPTEANAATPTETTVVQNIVEQNDNQGKQFIVADKQAGTLTMYTASGQQITSTPALFGKTEGDSVSSKNTPSGRFETKQVNVRTEGYGGSAQVLTQNGQNLQLGGSSYAIHRVYTKYASENRQGRLGTPTASDNRISRGCINVPVDFYDTYLNSDQDTVVYVMPETDAGRTGVFNVVPTATQATTDTKEQVEPAYDNANAQSVEVTPEQLTNATPHDQVKVAPKLVPTPLIVKGAEQSTQVAYTTPTVLGGANGTAPITADRIVTPKIDGKVVHTPAEQRADTSFDTEPVKDKTDDGISLAEVAVGLAAAFAGGMYMNRRRERAKAKKLESKKRTPVADNPPPTDNTPTPDPTPNMPQDPPTTEQVQDTVNAEHNEQVNKSANNGKSIPTDIKAPPQPTATALAVNREVWLKYLVETNQLGETGSQEMADLLLNTLRGFEYSNLAIMTDKSYQQANDGTFDDHRDWGDGEVDTDRIGIFNKFINLAAGATPIFDNLMGKLGIARGGYEADSSLASIALAQVKSKAQGAYAQIHKFFVGPMVERTKLLAQELRRGDNEVELATGRVATAKHVLNEAADAMWRGFDAELAHLQDSLDKVNADLAANPSNKDYPLRTMNTAKKLEDEIRQVSELYTRTRNMYEGKTAWDGETKLPGGMTKARAEQDIAEVKAEYGADYSKIEENAKELVKTIRGIRQFATAAGVFTNADIEVFNELGFDEYVPLYSEERDPTDMNEEDNYTQSSTMDRLMQGIPLTQARSMGLTKDLSRYRRKGAKSPAADGFTNMKKFAMNMAGRVGQQNWVEMTQQLYEGTVGKPYSTANITDPDTLADLNASYDSGKVLGLIRVRPGMKDFLPADVKAKIDKVRPIMGKGKNANGDTVAFEYYWTEPAIQAEIYANTDLSDTLTADYLRSIGTATRAAARLVTVGKPVWNIYNFVRDSFERVSVMLMRPVKNQNGNLVPKWKLATAFFRALPTIVLNAKDIYRYLVLGEVKTPLQTMLNEAVGEGAINLMTTQTEKHSVIGDLKKSQLEKAGNKISKWLGDTANKTGAGGARNALTKGLDFYIVAMTEIPQVSTALASYMAYQNVGVNKKESANRVRDAYDPNRTNNELIHNIGQFHPFVRSTFSGHYNLARSLTQYWKPGEWQFTLAYTLGGTLGVIGLLSMLAGAFDDDDDGRSALARLPLSTLMGGMPVPWGENGVWTLPVGFGMNKLIWGIGANYYRYINGYQSAGETAMGLAGLLVDNTSPIQATGGSNLAENPTAAAVLTAMPMLLKPIVEMGFNTKAYGGGKIWGKDTPQDQLDSQQDNFNTPETYKKWAGWLSENGFGDYRPETLRHLFESYGNLAGPLSAIPQSVIADQSEKTLGNKERKGEVFGATLTALGAGMSIQPNALDVANLTYEMDARRYELHRKYGVSETHTEEIYEQYAQRGKRGGIQKDAKYVTEVRLREKGVPEEHIKYIVNGMAYQKKRQELDKDFKDLALEYNRLVASGKEDLQMRQSVQNAWDALEKLTNDYVKENNNVFFTLR